MMNANIHLRNKETFWKFWQQLNEAESEQSEKLFRAHYTTDTQWNGSHPINHLSGLEALLADFWRPLKQAAPDIKRKTDILIAGQFEEQDWVSSTGYMSGTFVEDWLGIPLRGKRIQIRYGEYCVMHAGKITESYILMDLVGVMHQIGHFPLPPSYSGEDGIVPGPESQDGFSLEEAEASSSQRSLALVRAMLNGCMQYDQVNLSSMEQDKYWHPRKMAWYGPSGIGTTQGLQGFEDHHQKPFLQAFPNRKGGNHKCQIGDGNYVATTGWPSITATHAGSYLGVPASGKQITMRVMDWWRREDDRLIENWVLIDIIDLFLQLDIDLLANLPATLSGD